MDGSLLALLEPSKHVVFVECDARMRELLWVGRKTPAVHCDNGDGFKLIDAGILSIER